MLRISAPASAHSSPLLRGVVAGALALLLAACATQGRLTYKEFTRSSDYDTLNASMEDLKYKAREGPFYWPWPTLQQQVSAVNNLRWIAAYADDPGKREMALRTLVFVTAFNTDRAVRPLAKSRIETLWGDAKTPLHLRIAIIEAERDIVLGTLGFGGAPGRESLRPAKPGKRQDTALALLERLQDSTTTPYLQWRILEALGQILHNPPLPDTSLEKRQVRWQEELRRELLALLQLSDKDIAKNPARGAEKWPSDLRRALLALVSSGRSDGTPMPAPIRALLQERLDNPATSDKGFYDSALKRDEVQCVPADTSAPAAPAVAAPANAANPANAAAPSSESCSTNPSAPSLEVLLRNPLSNDDLFRLLDASLRKSRGTQGAAIIPSAILAFSSPGAELTPEQSRERRFIVFSAVVRAMRDGALLRGHALEKELQAALSDSADDPLQLSAWLQIAELSLPSFKAQGSTGAALIAYLAGQVRAQEDIHLRRLYLQAWLKLIDPQDEQAKKSLEEFKALPGQDVLTRHTIDVALTPPAPPPAEPAATPAPTQPAADAPPAKATDKAADKAADKGAEKTDTPATATNAAPSQPAAPAKPDSPSKP